MAPRMFKTRKDGLMKKATALHRMTGAQIALVFQLHGETFIFETTPHMLGESFMTRGRVQRSGPDNFETVANRRNVSDGPSEPGDDEPGAATPPAMEFNSPPLPTTPTATATTGHVDTTAASATHYKSLPGSPQQQPEAHSVADALPQRPQTPPDKDPIWLAQLLRTPPPPPNQQLRRSRSDEVARRFPTPGRASPQTESIPLSARTAPLPGGQPLRSRATSLYKESSVDWFGD